MKLATALESFSMMCSLVSLEMLESEHHLVTALSVKSWSGVMQMIQKKYQGVKGGVGSRNETPW